MRFGDDWAGAFPGIPALQSVGSSFIGRYAAFDHPRGIQKFEVDATAAAGMDVLTYYEESETWIQGGYAAGQRAGQNARQIWAAVGQHGDVPLFLAADNDYTAGQLQPISAALDGLASVIGRQNCGIYGGVAVVHPMRALGKATYAVQAGAWRYRAGEVGVTDPYGWSPLAQVRQDGYNIYVGNTQCDHLSALAADFGQWRRPVIDVSVHIDEKPWDPKQWDHNATVKQGASGSLVGYVQYVLNSAFSARIDIKNPPIFDAATSEWVEVLQTYGKLKVDGVVGPATWHLLGAYVARIHRYDLCPVLSLGDTDAGTKGKVHVLQQALNAVSVPGHTPLGVSGRFDANLLGTVVQFQKNRHLKADGIVGTATWSDLAHLQTSRGK